MKLLVTGATGLLGNNLTRLALERGHDTRVLARAGRDPRPLADLPVETVEGDVRDPAAVERACAGVDAVLHCAGLIWYGWTRMAESREVNVDGTRHVARAARQAGARLVHVSTISTLALGRPDAPADEDTPGDKIPSAYVVSKREAEAAVRTEEAAGLRAVIVNPGFMLGPWDWKPSSGQMLLEVARKAMLFVPPGGTSFCDARDVSAGVLAALERGQDGRRYILAGENLSFFEAWRVFAEVSGGWKPWFKLGPVLRAGVGWATDAWGRVAGREPILNSAALRTASRHAFYTSARAEQELGYKTRPMRASAEDAWRWFVENGYARRRGGRG